MKAPPDLAAELGADRDVLQVRIAAAQPAGRGHRLVEAGVHAAGLRVHELRQRVDVGALQLHQRPPLENQARQVVRERQLLEHFDRRRRRPRRAGPLQRPAAAACRTGSRDSCFGELMLNDSPASSKICARSRSPAPVRRCCDCAASAGPSMRTPARSTATSTGISGRSRSR